MKKCMLYNESERRFVRKFPHTIFAANYETVMVLHLLWKLTRKSLKVVAKVMKSYVRNAKVNKS